MVKQYYLLTKPGIIYGNLLPALAAFFLASHWHISILTIFSMVIGLGLVIASACVFNNYLDRGIDEKMSRTKKRALVTKIISNRSALIFGFLLGSSGFTILALWTNLLTTGIAFIGFFFYVVIYAIAKRQTTLGTLVGSIPGAVPPVVGYTAVTHQLDSGALVLFLILVTWQMPHFYAIATYRRKEYAQAGLPVLPVKKSPTETKLHMVFWIGCFLVVTSLLTMFKYTGFLYLVIISLLSVSWLGIGIQGFWVQDTTKWAKKMFFFSLIILLVTSVMIAVGGLLP